MEGKHSTSIARWRSASSSASSSVSSLLFDNNDCGGGAVVAAEAGVRRGAGGGGPLVAAEAVVRRGAGYEVAVDDDGAPVEEEEWVSRAGAGRSAAAVRRAFAARGWAAARGCEWETGAVKPSSLCIDV